MDKKRSVLNISISIIFRILLLVASLLVRRYLIRYIGNEANGLDSLYTSIIGFLSVAELGVGSAITFCMYKPIVEGNTQKVSALFGLFRKLYFIIGAIILLGGCAVMPFLPYLAKDYSSANWQLFVTFGLLLVAIVLSYAFSAEISLINAYKNNYITTAVHSGGQLLQFVLQVAVIITTRSFIGYFICRIVATGVQWGVTVLISRKQYGNIMRDKRRIDVETKGEVVKNVRAMFMHKIGGILVNTVDSIVISACIGVVILGKYTNYTVIMAAMTGTISLFFTPLTSVIGHMCIEENKESVCKYYNFFYTFNFVLGIIFFLGYYATIDNIVTICFGGGLEMNKTISLVITVNYFIQFMRQATLLFKDATGTFYNDRWKPLIEGLVNIALSIGFVYVFGYLWGENFAVVGVIAATILTNLFICHMVEPHVLFKYAFNRKAKTYYIKNYLYMLLFVGILFALHFTMITNENQWIEMLANGGISLAYSFAISLAVILCNKDFRYYIKRVMRKLKHSKTVEPFPPVADSVNTVVDDDPMQTDKNDLT